MFDGDHSKHSHWKNKLTDFCANTNAYWRAILKHIQDATQPINYDQLVGLHYGASNGWDLALDLWNFISKRLGVSVYERRIPLASNVEGSGFELWRALFNEHEGSDEFAQLDCRTKLKTSPAITTTAGITSKLVDWQYQRQ